MKAKSLNFSGGKLISYLRYLVQWNKETASERADFTIVLHCCHNVVRICSPQVVGIFYIARIYDGHLCQCKFKRNCISYLAVLLIGYCLDRRQKLTIFTNIISEADDVAEHRSSDDCFLQATPEHFRQITTAYEAQAIDNFQEILRICGSCCRATPRIVKRDKDV